MIHLKKVHFFRIGTPVERVFNIAVWYITNPRDCSLGIHFIRYRLNKS